MRKTHANIKEKNTKDISVVHFLYNTLLQKTIMGSRKRQQCLIKLENASKTYIMGEISVKALSKINVEILEGDFVAVIGASGSGKSTMMNLIGCLDMPTSGKVFLKGKDITIMKEDELADMRGRVIGFIFQQYNLISSMSAFQNVMLPLEFLEWDEAEAFTKTTEMLAMMDLADKTHHRPQQLSGGQQQRVSIARSLVTDPEIILADEPTGALDSKTGIGLLNTLKKLWKEQGKTIVLITHDLHLAKYAQKIIELKDGQIVQFIKNKR